MAKMTLLDIVQAVLNEIDSDQVNSINETFESEQVAMMVRDVYQAFASNRNWAHFKKLVNLTSSGSLALPTHITVPDNVKELISINYNKAKPGEARRRYQPVKYIDPDDFLRVTNNRNNTASDVDIITDSTGVELLIYNRTPPTYFTSFNDTVLVFDSYDRNVEDTIQESKIQAMAVVSPEWVQEDDFVPDLPEEAFSALLAECKSVASLNLKQMQNIKAEQESARQQNWLSRKAWKVSGGVKYPNFGRNGRKSCKDPTFRRD